MSNFGAKILNNAVRALNSQQAVIATTSSNISNVNTPGYSKRVVNLETAPSRMSIGTDLEVGSGVQVGGVKRVVDEFLNTALTTATSKSSASDIQNDLLHRAEELFPLTGNSPTIQSAMNDFFASVNDLTQDPSNIQLRQNVIQHASDLTDSIKSTYNALADLQTEADNRIASEIQAVNTITAQIAALNESIKGLEGQGQYIDVDDRDRRDQLLKDLAGKLSFSSIESTDGTVTISLSNGFTLVHGTQSNAIGATITPSFGTPPLPPSLNGGILSHIVYDYSNGAGTQEMDLTQTLQEGEGTIGGLLKFRGYNDPANTSAFQADGTIVDIASRVEAIARNLLTVVNQSYLGPDEDSVTAGFQSSAMDLDGNAPAVYGLFDFDYTAGAKDVDADGLPNDLNAIPLDNFASKLQVAFSDPRRFAAALDSDPVDASLHLSAGNGQNAEALAGLQSQSTTFAVGTFSLTGTYDDAYNELVGNVSSLKRTAETKASLNASALTSVETKRDAISAVSLDEEFTNLIKFQKAYQASARMIKVAQDLMDEVLRLI